ncbi:MAG: hypothetical protein NTW93_07065 [Phycisphaerae bacterium]|nr:hypothetical protein [Phycisphaerae bacterium]
MKKILLFSAIPVVLVIFSFYIFATADSGIQERSSPKLLNIDIIGPNSVPENTQNVFHVAAIYDNGSIVEVTPDANIMVTPEKHAVINLGGIIETFKQNQQEQFTIHANYRGFATEKLVIIYPLRDGHEK